MTQNKLTIGKEQLAYTLRDLGYTKQVSNELVDILLKKISTELLAGKSVQLSGTCILTPNFKDSTIKKVAGHKKHIQKTISISAKTSKVLVAAYRHKNNITPEQSQVKAVSDLFK